MASRAKRWAIQHLTLLLGLFVLVLLGLYVYAVYWQSQWFLNRGRASAPISARFGYGSERPLSDTPSNLQVRKCKAIVVGSITLALSGCEPDGRNMLLSLGVAAPPKGDDTSKALAQLVADQEVSCTSSQDCTARGVDLSQALLEAGLATLPQGNGDSERNPTLVKDRITAQRRAQDGRRGVWWDWSEATGHKEGDPDPTLWRGERDAMLPAAESTQASRAQAIGSYISQTMTLAIGILTGFLFSEAATRSKQERTIVFLDGRMKTAAQTLNQALIEISSRLNDLQPQKETLQKRVRDARQRLDELKRAVDAAQAERSTLALQYDELCSSCDTLFTLITSPLDELSLLPHADTLERLKDTFSSRFTHFETLYGGLP